MTDRLRIAKEDIERTFSQGPVVLTEAALRDIVREHRKFWWLSDRETLRVFIDFMLEKSRLQRVHVALPRCPIIGYTWGEGAPIMESLLQLVSGSYYSHYTAMRLHGLTEQVPKTLYLSKEKRRGSVRNEYNVNSWSQEEIDASFSKEPRQSSNYANVPEEGVRVVLLDAMEYHGVGIISDKVNLGGKRPLDLRFTSLERTFIDIVIRPIYAGGIFEVAKAFEVAKGRLSVNAMNALYKKLSPYFPYHQAIGFYLERAGYKSSLIELFRRYPMNHDFYIVHGMGKTSYNERWKLYIPDGF